MERVNRILEHDGYQECLRKNETAEKDRRFCRHDMAHFLDVARIAWILNLQEEAGAGFVTPTSYEVYILSK